MPSTLSRITPCIWLDSQAEEAVAFYVVPSDIGKWMASQDAAARDRASQAMPY